MQTTEASTVRVVAAVVRRYGRMLVCQRPGHKRHGGLWEFPGGKMEVGEGVLEAMQRELAEELGATVTSIEQMEFAFADPGSQFVIEFYPAVIEGELRCKEHTAFAWATPEELLDLPLAPSDREYAVWLNAGRSKGTGPGD